MKFVIITGLSGAGKSQAVKNLEDLGCYCVDNMPPELIPKFAEIFHKSAQDTHIAALVCDIRGGSLFNDLSGSLERLNQLGYDYEILFLEASDEVLINRYKETRHIHPLVKDGRVEDGIKNERLMLEKLRSRATHIIDTSMLTISDLKAKIKAIYCDEKLIDNMPIHITSFGFKNGLPLDADLVFDVRFLPNPFYIKELREHTGIESCVSDFVMDHPQSKEFLDKLISLMDFLIPYYEKEGKTQLVIGIGCTGGHHRSVAISEKLYKQMQDNDRNVTICHRDIHKHL